jgi:biotin carboxyl carrier protein
MKRIVNGVEVELVPSGAPIRSVGDRLMVTTPDGVYSAVAIRRGDSVLVSYRGRQYTVEPVKTKRTHAGKDHSGDLISSLPGAVVEVLVSTGEQVKMGQKVVVLEAMKTQQSFTAPFDGVVSEVHVVKGEQVSEGALLAVVHPIEE